MYNAKEIAEFFLSIDTDDVLKSENKIVKNGRNIIVGSTKLNKFLHLSQNIYIAKTGNLLFNDTVLAYDNGGVIYGVQGSFYTLKKTYRNTSLCFDKETEDFLKRMYIVLKDAPLDKLIELSHQDPSWKEKHNGYTLEEQIMTPLKYLEDYKNRYKDVLQLMEGLKVWH